MLVVDIVHGVLAYRIYEENTTADVFDNFLANEFMAVAGRGRYVMCDNLAAHFTDGKAAAGHRLIARPYSPDMAPIESCFSKLQAFLRRHSDNINAANFKFAVKAPPPPPRRAHCSPTSASSSASVCCCCCDGDCEWWSSSTRAWDIGWWRDKLQLSSRHSLSASSHDSLLLDFVELFISLKE